MKAIYNPFILAYIDAALWSSTAHGSPDEDEADPIGDDGQRRGTFDQSFERCNYDASDLSPALVAEIIEDCSNFQRDHADDLWNAGDASQNGHDFWLTRNGHGAGFWDRGYPSDLGRRLTDAAHVYGETNWYVGDDGLIYS